MSTYARPGGRRPNREIRAGSVARFVVKGNNVSDEAPVLLQQQQRVEQLASWLVSEVNTEPGWEALVLELKPQGDSMLMRITEQPGGGSFVGHLEQGAEAYENARKLRSLSTDAWVSMSLRVGATGWPKPKYSIDAHYNFDHPAPDFGLGESSAVQEADSSTPEPSPGVDNSLVADAVEAFSRQPSAQSAINVARQVLGTDLLLDFSADQGRPGISVVDVRGVPSVLAFTSQAQLVAFRHTAKGGGEATSLVQAGEELLRFIANHQEIGALQINPGGPTCVLGQREVAFVLGSLANRELKLAATASDPIGMALQALRHPDAAVLLADRPGDEGRTGPLVLAGPGGRVVLPVFSSGAEVAAYDPSLKFTRVSADWVLGGVLKAADRDLVVNPAGPPIYLGRDRIISS